MSETLRIGPNAVHLCIDMQRLFAEQTEWHTPTLADIVPNIAMIIEAKPGRTILDRKSTRLNSSH